MKNIQMKRKRAFTLIELLVVILILAILAALIVPKIVGRTDDAKIGRAQADIKTLSDALSQFRLDTGRYPTTEEGLQSLVTQPENADGWKGSYIKKLPQDPWNSDYYYEEGGNNGEDFTLLSYGSDHAPGGDGPAQDIGGSE